MAASETCIGRKDITMFLLMLLVLLHILARNKTVAIHLQCCQWKAFGKINGNTSSLIEI